MEKWIWLEGCHRMRNGLLEDLTEEDLAFNPGGGNLPLGEMFREIGEAEQAYINSLQSFEINFSYRYPDPSIANRIDELITWFQELDETFKTSLQELPDSKSDTPVLRPAGNSNPLSAHIEIYIQAMMIFFGKAIVYYRAMDKPLPPNIDRYIA